MDFNSSGLIIMNYTGYILGGETGFDWALILFGNYKYSILTMII